MKFNTAYIIAFNILHHHRLALEVSLAAKQKALADNAFSRVCWEFLSKEICVGIKNLQVKNLDKVHVAYNTDRAKVWISLGTAGPLNS